MRDESSPDLARCSQLSKPILAYADPLLKEVMALGYLAPLPASPRMSATRRAHQWIVRAMSDGCRSQIAFRYAFDIQNSPPELISESPGNLLVEFW